MRTYMLGGYLAEMLKSWFGTLARVLLGYYLYNIIYIRYDMMYYNINFEQMHA